MSGLCDVYLLLHTSCLYGILSNLTYDARHLLATCKWGFSMGYFCICDCNVIGKVQCSILRVLLGYLNLQL
jgi:hypothetical protein